MEERPRAHPDLIFERHDRPEGPMWKVFDPTQGTIFWFNPRSFAVLDAMDGLRTADAIADAVGARDAEARKTVFGLIQAFARAGLLASGRSAARSDRRAQGREPDNRLFWGQLRAVPLGEVAEAVLGVADAMTSDCAICELRCCTYAVDVQADEVERLVAAAARLPVPRERLFHVSRPPGSREALPLTRLESDGACVLYDREGEGGCRVHADSGLDAKPVACQLYPTVLTVRPDGARLGARVGCAHPGRSSAPEAVARHRGMLERLVATSPMSAVRRAPEEVVVVGDVKAPWERYAAWEREAVAAVRAAPDAATGIEAAIAAALTVFGVPAPTASEVRALSLAGALSTVVREQAGSDAEAEALVAVASQEAPPSPRPFPKEAVVVALEALEPLRHASVLAGLGVLRLAVAVGDRHALAARRPAEAAAAVFRCLDMPNVAITLSRSTEASLAGLATVAL